MRVHEEGEKIRTSSFGNLHPRLFDFEVRVHEEGEKIRISSFGNLHTALLDSEITFLEESKKKKNKSCLENHVSNGVFFLYLRRLFGR